MSNEYITIVESNLIVFMHEFQKLVQDGWEMNPLEYPDFSRVFSVGLQRTKEKASTGATSPAKELKVGEDVVGDAIAAGKVVEAGVLRQRGRPAKNK